MNRNICEQLGNTIQAVLMDVDGTLYSQRKLRYWMSLELARYALARRSPLIPVRVLKILLHFRHNREMLREHTMDGSFLENIQYENTARSLEIELPLIKNTVFEWIHQRPLKYLRRCRRSGVDELCILLRRKNIRLGVFSDYPAEEKLEALDLREYFELFLCATDPDINAFKPQPEGFLRACSSWGLDPARVLYIGDRIDTDMRGAQRAGMPCIIVGRRGCYNGNRAYTSFERIIHDCQKH